MAVMTERAMLTPGTPIPAPPVPEHIERPEYVWKDSVRENVGEPVIQTPETIERMREASRIAANALALAGAAAFLIWYAVGRRRAIRKMNHGDRSRDS